MKLINSIFSAEEKLLESLPLGDNSMVVAILDGPADIFHPVLKDAFIECINPFDYPVQIGMPATDHGTQIASIIFGQADSDFEGLAPKCRGVLIPVYKDSETGAVEGVSQLMLASAIDCAINAGAKLINISGGQISRSSLADSILEKQIRRCNQAGILIVAAAGNEGCPCLRIPAAINGVLPVGAHDYAGFPLASCNFGQEYAKCGILAPGDSIPVVDNTRNITTKSGTSFAAAIVSGAIARISSALSAKQRDLTSVEIGEFLYETADECNAISGRGACLPWPGRRLNIQRAVTKLALCPENSFLVHINEIKGISMEKNDHIGNLPIVDNGMLTGFVQPASDEAHSLNVGYSTQISPACEKDCGCKKNGGADFAQPVYAIGQLDIDFGTEARRDSFFQHLNSWREENKDEESPLNDREVLKEFLSSRPEFDQGLTWVLKLDVTVIYALRPSGPYAQEISRKLREAYVSFSSNDSSRVDVISIPGVAKGSAKLLNGQMVPLLYPDLRGIYDWSIDGLVKATTSDEESDEINQQKQFLTDFLNRIYFEFRNLGQSGTDRALNYSATHAWEAAHVFERAVSENLVLGGVPEVVKSPICRPESECYDVVLTFFNPAERLTKASRAFRFTVDVSDILPVMVGPVRSWYVFNPGIA